MGKLKAIQPRLKPIGSRLKPAMTREVSEQQRHKQRDREQHWRKWYKTSKWQKLRWKVLVDDLFTCQMKGCGRIEPNTALLVADHKFPHHGDERLFWDRDNLQCLCKPCHDRLKQAEERRSPRW